MNSKANWAAKLDKFEYELNVFNTTAYETNKEADVGFKYFETLLSEIMTFIEYRSLSIDTRESEDDTLLNRAIVLLANQLGCAEHIELYERRVSMLYDQKLIKESHVNLFEVELNDGRWR